MPSRRESYTERTTPTGHAFATFTVRRTQSGGSKQRNVLAVQGFYPFPATTWTLSLGITSPHPEHQEQLLDMVIRCMGSIRIDAPGSSGVNTPTLDSAVADTPVPDSDDDESEPFSEAIKLISFAVRNE